MPWCRSRLAGHLSKNRYKHVRVRFSPAIHGLRHFWKGAPQAGTRTLGYSRSNNWLWETPTIVWGTTGWKGFSKPLRAMDGPKRAYRDVLVGVF
jgi:hypothetical protein